VNRPAFRSTINTTVTRMNKLQESASSSLWPLLALTAALGASPALAAGKPSAAAASEAQYQRDAAVCLSRGYKGARNECLSDASTARASREPVTIDPDPGRYARNALKRCEPLTEPDRSDCVARIQGKGTTTGSVAGGGIYRELVTREVVVVPAPPASAASQ
jgi:uncharacterized membrane protein